jgi:hypothetical protein
VPSRRPVRNVSTTISTPRASLSSPSLQNEGGPDYF